MQYKNVVTSFLTTEGKILLLRRSAKVGTHQGKWSGVSGYLEGSEEPVQRAQTEIQEELGLTRDQIRLVRAGEVLRAFDESTETVWVIHPFLFEANSKSLHLDWENSEYKWIDPIELRAYQTVPKLHETFDRVYFDLETTPTLSNIFSRVEELAHDRVHGATYFGQKALELLVAASVSQRSEDVTAENIFCILMAVALRLRKSQPGMANVRNLVGNLLYQADMKRGGVGTASEFVSELKSIAEKLDGRVRSMSEDASRNAAAMLPDDGCVLTHSYSTTVLRALELGMKAGRKFQAYVTESYPGMEGKQLAKALVQIGVPVRLVADSTVEAMISDVNLVLVGADSVLKDGSLLHKIGTRNIAAKANERGIPLYAVCETMKFSTADFLGEHIQASETLFDVTPSKFILKFITEDGPIEPREVEGRTRLLLSEMYP